MDKVYLSHNNIVSGYGFDSTSAIDQIEDEISSLSLIEDTSILPQPFYSSRIQQNSLEAKYAQLNSQEKHTRLEQLFLVSLLNIILKLNLPKKIQYILLGRFNLTSSRSTSALWRLVCSVLRLPLR